MKLQRFYMEKNASVKAEQTAKETFEGKGFSKNLPEIRVTNIDVKKVLTF